MLDRPDSWSKGWVLQEREAPFIKERQQGRGITMWAGIYSDAWPEMTDINILIRCEFAYHVEFGFICEY